MNVSEETIKLRLPTEMKVYLIKRSNSELKTLSEYVRQLIERDMNDNHKSHRNSNKYANGDHVDSRDV